MSTEEFPVPSGMQRRPGVLYGCGKPDCQLCYERQREAAPTSPAVPPGESYWSKAVPTWEGEPTVADVVADIAGVTCERGASLDGEAITALSRIVAALRAAQPVSATDGERVNELMEGEAYSRLRQSLQRFRDDKGKGLKDRQIAALAGWLLPLAQAAVSQGSERRAHAFKRGGPAGACAICACWENDAIHDAPPPASEPGDVAGEER